MKVTYINSEDLIHELKLAGWMAMVSSDRDVDPLKVVKHCIKSNHGTPTRAMRFVFEISGISRACSHELVRHELGVGKVQRSQRYVKEDGFKSVIPASIKNNPGMIIKFYDLLEEIQDFYNEMVGEGIKPEDARYILPNATCTAIRCSFSWEALTNFMRRRRCFRAQWEIRQVADEIYRQVKEALEKCGMGDLVIYLERPCDQAGKCVEGYSCGYYDRKVKAKNND